MHSIFLAFILFFFTLPLFGAYHHRFALEGDFILWKRSKGFDTTLVKAEDRLLNLNPDVIEPLDLSNNLGRPLLRSRALVKDMNSDPGLRVSAKLFYSPRATWTLSYVGLLNWKGEDQINYLETLTLPMLIERARFDYRYADQAKAIYNSDFYTIDLTYLRHVTPRYIDHFSVSWMIGVRFIDLDEKIQLYFTKKNRTSRYQVKTFSRAFGPLFGGNFEYNPYSFLTWGLAGNLGCFVNHGNKKTVAYDLNNTILVSNDSRNGTNFAYFAQMYPFIEYRFEKFFTLRAGYEVLYMGRVVLANRQFSGPKDHLDHEGNLVYHGLFAGIQFNF